MEQKNKVWGLAVGTVGVVYGDIGTSPLYAVKGCFSLAGLPVTEQNVLGLISLFIWTLFIVVSLKYVRIVMKADDQGEGGILVLSTLCTKLRLKKLGRAPFWLGIIGAALFFGDGFITPAISVLGALEGLKLIYPIPTLGILGLSIAILTVLFLLQQYGTDKIGRFFGPVMVLWFVTISLLGVKGIIQTPQILWALNPFAAVSFFIANGWAALLTLGGSILILTGAEALYADMGHFGRQPINGSWKYLVFPALTLNYMGQGGLLLADAASLANPFYLLAPQSCLTSLILLSTLATIIASQSVISGLFSVGWQAVMLNLLPRLRVFHTSAEHVGQVYVPAINKLLYCLTVAAVLKFQSSENLAIAYGLSVSGVMLITTLLVSLLAYQKWQWHLLKLVCVFLPLLCLDLTFFFVSLRKILEGGSYMIGVTAIVSTIVYAWIRGNQALYHQKASIREEGLALFLQGYSQKFPQRIPGVAVYMCRYPDHVPNSLFVHLKHNRFFHEKMIFLSIITKDVPRVPSKGKIEMKELREGCYAISENIGFKEVPDLYKVINWVHKNALIESEESISFFLSKGVPIPSGKGLWRRFLENIYIFLVNNSLSASSFFKIPNHKVIELGVRYKL